MTDEESEEAKVTLKKLYSNEPIENRDGVLSRFGQLMTLLAGRESRFFR